MLLELYYIFCKYGKQIAEKYGYGYKNCYLQLNREGGGHLAGDILVTTTGGGWCPQLSKVILSWTTLDEGVKLLRKELAEVLESGGKKWN